MGILYPKKLLAFLSGQQGFPLVLGIIVGLSLNLLTMPFFERACSDMLQQATISGGDADQSTYTSPDQYEPRVVRRDPEEIAHKMAAANKKVVRPRYYSTELGIKEKVMVCVMTEPGLLKEFGVAVNQTLNHHVDKLLFFVDGSPDAGPDLPVVAFPGTALPHTQIFRIISYLQEKYTSSFDYFLLVDAKESMPYINGRALHRALSHISVSRPMHFGVPTSPTSHYCTLTAGVVLSGPVVSSVAASVSWCTQHSSQDQHTNLGRCVMHATALPCTSTLQEKLYSTVALAKGSDSLQTVALAVLPFTVTGVRQPQQLLSVHHHYLTREVALLQESIAATREVILAARRKAPLYPLEDTWPVGSPPPHHPSTRYDVINWITFNSSHVFMPDEHRNTAPLSGPLLQDLTGVVVAAASHVTNSSEGRLQLQGLSYGHYRLDPVRGTDYLLALLFRDTATGTLLKKIVEASRSITNTEFVPMPYVTENTEVTLLVTVAPHQQQQAIDFIARFVENKAMSGNAVLLLVLRQSGQHKGDNYKEVRAASNAALLRESRVRHTTVAEHQRISSVNVTDLYIMDQVVRKVSSSSLVFVVPVSAELSFEVLNRVRMNTILGKQLFSPVVYGLYHPSVIAEKDSSAYASKEVKAGVGHYLLYDYSCISFYMTDYKKARKLSSGLFPIVESSRKIVGRKRPAEKYHISLFRLFLAFSSLHALRAPEPFIRLPYENVVCSSSSSSSATESSHTQSQLQSDVTLLMGASSTANNAAFYRHVLLNSRQRLQGEVRSNWTLDDFRGDGHCHDRWLNSFGTRLQLSKLIIDYDRRHGKLSR